MTRRASQREREATVFLAVLAGGLAVLSLWLRDTSLAEVQGLANALTAAGRVTGLAGAYMVLVQITLMSRLPWLDRWIGTDRLAAWHRVSGQLTICLLLAHAVLITLGYAAADHFTIQHESWTLIRSYPDVLAAMVALGLLVAVGVTSVRAARKRLRYETWFFIHLYTYVAIALSVAHQLMTGNEFVARPLNRLLWISLYLLAFAPLVAFRVVAPIVNARRLGLRVEAVQRESAAAVSLWITGRNLDRLRAEPGQFFRWRFLAHGLWWEAHPFSLSRAPSNDAFRLTVKARGDHSRALHGLAVGTRVIAEGPYGSFTARRRTRAGVLLIAGGVGITPIRAMLETLHGEPGDLVLLYIARTQEEVLFRSELDELADDRGIEVVYLVGTRGDVRGPLTEGALRQRLPDVATRDVFLCGPAGLMQEASTTLRALGVPRARIHTERFEF
jgi:predicted ferric reductase